MNWFYVSAGKQTGPVDDAQLNALAASGQIQPETLVWHEGMPEWQPYNVATGQPGAAAAPPTMAAAPVSANEVVCAECGRIFPREDTIQFGTVRVCAGCKPIFMQKLAEGASVSGQLVYARILARFGAVFLDGIILLGFSTLTNVIAGRGVAGAFGRDSAAVSFGLQMFLYVLNTVAGCAYETFMIGKFGATLGKMACKVRVVAPDGSQISYARALGRYFAKWISSVICMIGYIIAIFDDEKRALHDRIVNTRVISTAP